MLGILVSVFFILLVVGVPIAFAIGVSTFIPLLLDGRLPFTLVTPACSAAWTPSR